MKKLVSALILACTRMDETYLLDTDARGPIASTRRRRADDTMIQHVALKAEEKLLRFVKAVEHFHHYLYG